MRWIHRGYQILWKNYKQTDRGFYIVTMLISCLFAGGCGSAVVKNRTAGFLAGAVLAFLVANVGIFILGRILKVLLRHGGNELIYLLLDGSIMIYFCTEGSVGAKEKQAIFTAVVATVSMALFGKSMWAAVVNQVRSKLTGITLVISGVLTAAFVVLLTGQGFLDTYVKEYHAQSRRVLSAEKLDGFEDYGREGSYETASVLYGFGEELKTDTVDLSRYVSEEKIWHRLYRGLFQDYGLADAPVAGKIWYPVNAKNCPVIFMAHGNHSITEESYLGYDYLGSYLASQGYVFVSVDENVLNERSNENDARAVLLLENIKAIEHFNNESGNVLYGKMDYDNIGLAGHSRGGEMIVDAYLFNEYDAYPSNGMFKFDYHFHIKSLLAVAPSVNQYMPAGHETEITDVSYLVLQGANDQDISVFMGNEQYENISFSGEGDYLKSSLYIAGANHGQFNTVWGKYDTSAPFCWWLNVKNFITEAEQQEILKIYARAFFDKTLKGEDTYADLLTDYGKYASYLPETIYAQQYEKSKNRMITDFEDDSDLESAGEYGWISADHFSMWTEEKLFYSDESMGKRENHALRLKWNNTLEAWYQISFRKPQSLLDSSIHFDASNLDDGKEDANTLDFSVVLTDQKGRTARTVVGDEVALYPAFQIRLSKVQYLWRDCEEKYQFQTVELPIEKFAPEDGFDSEHIISIRFEFDRMKNGKVNIDNIGI